jgi:hypothetical protein
MTQNLLSTITDEYAKYWTSIHGKLFPYEWARNFLSVRPLRRTCSKACWMSDSAWTEWKSFSLPRPEFVAWRPDSTPSVESSLTTLGIKLRPRPGSQQYETNTAALKNVQQLRISKSLTCDELRDELTLLPETAWTPSLSSVFATTASRGFGKTFLRSSVLDSSRPPWIGDREMTFVHRVRKNTVTTSWRPT